jgi:outer membrane protein assembly factor BamB
MSKLISITIASLLLIGILIQSSVSADDWVMVGHDARHTCYSTSKAPDTNKTLWIHELEEGGEIYLSAANNKVFVANEDVYALDDENGKLLWRFETEGYSVSPPAIYNGKLFATTSDDIIYSIDANSGKLIWKTSLGSWAKEAPILYENIVLAGELEGIIYALRIDNGKIIWSFESPGGHATSIYPTVTAKDGKVFNGKYALDAKTGI